MKILLFGQLGERIGREVDAALASDGCTIAELRHALAEQWPAMTSDLASGALRFAVDQEIVDDSFAISPGQEVALFSVLSGG
ncbi:MoaD/ThiS family protein [Sphingosinicella rhizophila]|uniref:MoaD/ThiS family protein n=1 Tax=Sphingosinicella rhizophila TaxID=3050082 RepID=A0ABU3QBX6_9SPHN|nr:MoaD/ThiS family protein [Sphingosinicella sp. GR2756]MDT9600894.1 MoaD/ThiS family protein [Sphingosinicella sp. GR2756]